jgi:hypothetical protein
MSRGGNPHAPILDYAGPISRSRLRLPAKSELHITLAPDRLVARETLAGREGAIGALMFAAFVMVVMAFVQWDMAHKWRRNVAPMLFCASVMAAEASVAGMVIHQTWRRTVLEVTREELLLTFAAPFVRTTRLRWPAELVADVLVVDSAMGALGGAVPELDLRMWSGPPVRLFTGHPHKQLMYVSEQIRLLQPPLPTREESST